MRQFGRTGAFALTLACSVTMVGIGQAQAGFLDFLRNNRHGQRPQQVITLPAAPVGLAPDQAQMNKPLPKVSGPRYYAYKTEALRLVSTAGFADPLVTAAVASTATDTPAAIPDGSGYGSFADVKVKANADIASALEAYYGSGGRIVWVTGSEINARARAAMAVLSDAASVGLDPRDYAVALPGSASADVADPAAGERGLMQFELALSAKVLAYVQDTQRGRVDPNKISGYHDFKRKDVNLAPVLKLALMSPDVGAYLASRSPSGIEFTALKEELAKRRAEQSPDEAVVITLDGALKPGMSSPDMAGIVAAIRKHGSDALKTEHSVTLATYAQTPEYTPELVALVEAFQKQAGLKPDGVIGQATVRALVGESDAARIDKLVVAMEQARWLPNDLGSRYVFINQPAFMVYYHEGGKEQLSMRVVVGSKSNQTYFFQDQIETVEFNPFWGVPQSIIINEMLPKLRQDPNYLDRLGYEVAVGGQAVSSSSVNWYGSTSGVSVRQPPSSDNALGELKILFPNSHAIYMHDTPSKSFFKKDMRALSHGCVRLADPRAMAAAVLGTTVADVASKIDAGRNKAVTVPQKIPVYVSYFTAWPNKDGTVEYFNDVYGRDAYIQKAFAATTDQRAQS